MVPGELVRVGRIGGPSTKMLPGVDGGVWRDWPDLSRLVGDFHWGSYDGGTSTGVVLRAGTGPASMPWKVGASSLIWPELPRRALVLGVRPMVAVLRVSSAAGHTYIWVQSVTLVSIE
jgi:hypothetical protein